MIKLQDLLYQDNFPKEYLKKFNKFLGKTVSFKYNGKDEKGKSTKIDISGTFTGYGTSQLAKLMKSNYYTFTVNRTAIRVTELDKVEIKLHQLDKRI